MTPFERAKASEPTAERALAPRSEDVRVVALGLLECALARLERAQAERGQREQFTAFKPWLVAEPSPAELSSIANSLGLGIASARTARHALRQRLGRFLHEELSNLLGRRDDTDGLRLEMVTLLGALER